MINSKPITIPLILLTHLGKQNKRAFSLLRLRVFLQILDDNNSGFVAHVKCVEHCKNILGWNSETFGEYLRECAHFCTMDNKGRIWYKSWARILVEQSVELTNKHCVVVQAHELKSATIFRAHIHSKVCSIMNGYSHREVTTLQIKKKPIYLRSRKTLNNHTGIGSANTSINYEKLAQNQAHAVTQFEQAFRTYNECVLYIKHTFSKHVRLIGFNPKAHNGFVYYVYRILGNRYKPISHQLNARTNTRKHIFKKCSLLLSKPTIKAGVGNLDDDKLHLIKNNSINTLSQPGYI